MKIAIAGFGLEGLVNYSYFSQNYPEAELVIADERENIENLPDGVNTILGPGAFDKLDGFDMVVRTAGLSPHKIKTDGKIWSGTNEFFAKCPAPIIGVTGTKGKGTTASLIASVLEAAGKKAHLVGNIGTPALEVLSDISPMDFVVYELSSFQLWDIQKSPKIAVVLMIEPDHLDVHANFDEYVEAKAQIVRWQEPEDTTIYHPTNEFSAQIASRSAGEKRRYGIKDDGGVYVEDNQFKLDNHAICSVEALHLVGRHNLENASAAISAVKSLLPGLEDQAIAKGLSNFEGLDHRLKFVTEKSGVKFYDDSIATTPGSVIAAIRSFDQPKVLILGGMDKGADYEQMAEQITDPQNQVRAVVLIGSNADSLTEVLNQKGSDVNIKTLGNKPMTEIVSSAAVLAKPGDVVVLSPAASSFDMFNNYKDRGNQFAQAAKSLS